ncbi:MAG: type I restriction-modification system subunit M N-terminal domain-containing protein, partial [Ruminococcus sp.]|uniref:type I restriction-modification system subunit M N-terminal domain-containing protein n=1 Tax=Ruminococcus sp. TaxID=41978 RepID=UPI00399064F7
MSDNKREQERTELYRTIWALANELRGSVDGWDFKQYVLGMLFYRYISENLTTYLNKGEWEVTRPPKVRPKKSNFGGWY